ncbi:MAG: hypothetical protein ACWA49_08070 [Ruegeria sp.]
MTSKHRYHGGLQFNGDTNGAMERFGHIVVATLEDYGHLVERKTLLSKSEASVVSSQYLVRLTLESEQSETDDHYIRLDRTAGLKTIIRQPATRPRNRLTISVSPVSGLLDDTEISELMLVVMLYRMVDICSTQRVEWLSPSTVLTIEQFMSAFDSLMPGKQRNRRQVFASVSGPFAGVESGECEDTLDADIEINKASAKGARPIQLSDDQLLSIAFRTESDTPITDASVSNSTESDRPSDALRLSSWAMTGAVASLSAPIALSMAAVNLIRGEDFRLNTQVLAFTVAIVSLNSTRAFAEVASAIGM